MTDSGRSPNPDSDYDPMEQLPAHLSAMLQPTDRPQMVTIGAAPVLPAAQAIFTASAASRGALMLQAERLIYASAVATVSNPPLTYPTTIFTAVNRPSVPVIHIPRIIPSAAERSRNSVNPRHPTVLIGRRPVSGYASATDQSQSFTNTNHARRNEQRMYQRAQPQYQAIHHGLAAAACGQQLAMMHPSPSQQKPTEELRLSTSSAGTVERGADHSLADAADEGPPAKKPRSMQSAGIQSQHQCPPKSVGQRIKETLQTSKSQLCRSPNVADANVGSRSLSPHPLGAAQVNTIRIIGQYLKNLGLQETVATLFAESGCRLEDTLAIRLREYILAGEWDHALNIVDKMAPFVTRPNLLRIREKLFEEKFVDLLDKERILEALTLLTIDFPSDPAFAERRNFLATLLYVDPKNVDVCAKTGAHRTRRERNALISEIQQLLPTSIMLPCNRLEKLLMQSWKMQCRECYLHVREDVDVTPDYILEDHQCDWDRFPMFTSQVLTKHTDEVWCAAFSRCGKYLATGSRSGSAHVWKVINECTVEHYREFGGRNSSSLLTWSDDGTLLAISAAEGHLADVHVYDVHSGTTFCVIENRSNDSTVMSFVPNSSSEQYRLVCADQMGHFCQYALSKENVKAEGKFEGYRIRAIHCLRSGSVLAADTHNRVRSYRFSDDSEVTLIEELSQIATFVVDKAERRILIDTKLHGLRLWDLRTRSLIRTFIGAPHQDFVIHSAFGGSDQSYIATGSIDECVYVWKHSSDELIAKLSGHTARVNAVAWNPKAPQLVSCSDDCTVRIWSPIADIDPSNIRQN